MRGSNINIPWRLCFSILVLVIGGYLYRDIEVDLIGDDQILSRAKFFLDKASLDAEARKIVVVGGSTAMMGILPEEIESKTGLFTINAALSNQLYSHINTFDYADALVRRGDVILYQSPALIGDNQDLPVDALHDRRAIFYRKSLGLESGFSKADGGGGWSLFFLIPTQPLVKTAWNYVKDGKADFLPKKVKGNPAEIVRCDEATKKVFPAKYRQKMSSSYFHALKEFDRKMYEKGVSVYYVFPTYYVRPGDLPLWEKTLAESKSVLQGFYGKYIDIASDNLFRNDPALFCDARHATISLASFQTAFISSSLHGPGISESAAIVKH